MRSLLHKARSGTVKHIVSAIVLSSFYYLVQFVFTKIIAEKISVEDFGEYRYFFSILSFAALFNLGFIDGFQIEWIVKRKSINYKYIVASIVFTTCTSLVSLFFFNNKIIALLLMINLIIANIGFVYQIVFIKYNYFLFYLLPIIFSQLAQIIVLMLLPSAFTLTEILYLHTGLNAFFILGVIIFSLKKSYVPILTEADFSFDRILEHIKTGFPITISGLVLIGFLNIDKLILKSSYSELDYGYYCFASLIALVVYGVLVSMASMLLKKMVDADYLEGIYNKTLYILLVIPLFMFLAKGLVNWGIKLVFPKYTASFAFFVGYVNFYFPMVANNLVMLNFFKREHKVGIYASIASLFLLLQALVVYTASKIGVGLAEIPFLMSILPIVWFGVNDYMASRILSGLRKQYYKRTAIILFILIVVFVLSWYFR